MKIAEILTLSTEQIYGNLDQDEAAVMEAEEVPEKQMDFVIEESDGGGK